MGLLDDPNLVLGLGLLSAGSAKPVRTGLGEGLLSALSLQQQFKQAEEDRKLRMEDQAMRRQAMQMQLDQQRRAQEAQANKQKLLGAMDPNQGPALPPSLPQMLAADFSPQEIALLAPQAKDPREGLAKIDPKDYTPESFAQYLSSGNPALLRAAPKDAGPTELAKLMAERDRLPPNHPARAVYDQQINKITTHQPAVQNINYGSPMPAVNPATGKVELVRPDNKGGMSFTGIEPPPQNRDTKLPAEIQRMNIAADSMVSLLGDYEAWLKKNNPRDPTVQMSPQRRAEMQSLMKNIQLQYKELAALGALAGPDLALMEAALTDPFTVKGAWYGPDGLLSQIRQARNLVTVRKGAIGSNSGVAAPAQAPANDDPLGLRK